MESPRVVGWHQRAVPGIKVQHHIRGHAPAYTFQAPKDKLQATVLNDGMSRDSTNPPKKDSLFIASFSSYCKEDSGDFIVFASRHGHILQRFGVKEQLQALAQVWKDDPNFGFVQACETLRKIFGERASDFDVLFALGAFCVNKKFEENYEFIERYVVQAYAVQARL